MNTAVDILVSILPVFVIIAIGHVLRRNSIPGDEYWNYADKLVYWLLFPALLFYKTSTIEFSTQLVGPFALVLLGGFGVAALVSALLQKAMRLPAPAYSSVLQGAVRHNTFIALAVAERLFGPEGLALAAIATSVLVPVTNVTVVVSMVSLLAPPEQRGAARIVVRELARNPLIVSIVLGVACNLSGVGELPVLHDTTRILGGATLPVVLLCIGASLRIRAMRASLAPFLASASVKLLVFPLAMFALIAATGLHGVAAQVAFLYGGIPTASSGYALARQMGGDAPLMAAIITLQTLLALLTLPAAMVVARVWLG